MTTNARCRGGGSRGRAVRGPAKGAEDPPSRGNRCRAATIPAIRRSGDPAIRRSGDPAIRRSGDPAIRRSGDPAIRRSGDPAILIVGLSMGGASTGWINSKCHSSSDAQPPAAVRLALLAFPMVQTPASGLDFILASCSPAAGKCRGGSTEPLGRQAAHGINAGSALADLKPLARSPLPKGGRFTLIPHRQPTGQTLFPILDLRECQAALSWLASHQFLPGSVLWYGHAVPKGAR